VSSNIMVHNDLFGHSKNDIHFIRLLILLLTLACFFVCVDFISF
jgi:hypothetical protein